nr:hypothetical protein YSBCXYJI_YSBCXYJI_CDS_0073 [Caudoviricetes sp.]
MCDVIDKMFINFQNKQKALEYISMVFEPCYYKLNSTLER